MTPEFILKLITDYITENPDQVRQLMKLAVDALIKYLQEQNK